MTRGTYVPAEYVERYGLAAVMLAQLDWLYNEAKHVAWVEREGHRWLIYPDHEWGDSVGLGVDQARRARRKLEEAGEVVCATHRVKGVPTTFLRRVQEPAAISPMAEKPAAISPGACGDIAESPAAISPNPPLYETEETREGDARARGQLVGVSDDTLATSETFDATWALYPRKLNRKGAQKAWVAQVRKGSDPAAMHRAVENYARLREGRDPTTTMHGATFFGPNDRWEDYVDGIPEAEVPRPERKESRGERNLRIRNERREQRQDVTPMLKGLMP